MPVGRTVQDAVEIAERFVGKYYPFCVLERGKRERDVWVVEFDVGALKPQIVGVKLDARTGKVVDSTKAALQA